MARPADEALIGRTLAGKFVVESFIGGGAMGAVYRARQLSLDKSVAIKVLHGDLVSDPTFIARFQREAKAASRLDHPNSMRVLDYGRDADGLCYIAMELLDGQSLFALLREARGPLPDRRTVDLLRQVLAALAVAHEMGVVHRDLKPENIIVLQSKSDDGNVSETVKVCDFGMAKVLTDEGARDASLEKLTSQGVIVGTPEYMSPEQGKGEELDIRSDLYSVGVILYQMLTGRLPFQADTPIATVLKHLVEEPKSPSQLIAGVNLGLEAICLRALKKEREDRFASAREMRTALRNAATLGARAADPAMPPSPGSPLDSSRDAFAANHGDESRAPAHGRRRPRVGGGAASRADDPGLRRARRLCRDDRRLRRASSEGRDRHRRGAAHAADGAARSAGERPARRAGRLDAQVRRVVDRAFAVRPALGRGEDPCRRVELEGRSQVGERRRSAPRIGSVRRVFGAHRDAR
jgi:serine/threonine protein kinase